MEWVPSLSLVWPGGWILLAVEFLVEGIALLLMPKSVRIRLFDRKGWNKKQRIFTILGKVFSLVCLVLIVLTPLNTRSILFIPGLILFTIGLAGLVTAMINFRDTPLDAPVTRGLYRISRHPQIFSISVAFLGICMAIGSFPALLAFLISRLLQHFGILGEEEVCLAKYGDPYRKYLARVPRYFLFF